MSLPVPAHETVASAKPAGYDAVVEQIGAVVEQARQHAAIAVNTALVSAYWQIGEIILANAEALQTLEKRGRGRPGLASVRRQLADRLKAKYPHVGIGLSERSLRYAQQLVETWSDVQPIFGRDLLPKIGWDAHMRLIDGFNKAMGADPDVLVWYASQTIEHGWSSTILKHQIMSGACTRRGRALSNYVETLPAPTAEQAQAMLNSPVALDLLLPHGAKERELERRLVERAKEFMLALGPAFTFKGNQFRLEFGGDEFFVDLLLFNTDLLCWVVVELKVTEFEPEYASKLDLYVRLVDDTLRKPGHSPTVGILLCPGGNGTVVS